jgi:uncharacterized surface protein with fasciclin (FAS1) repeats
MNKKLISTVAGLALLLLILAPVDARYPRQDDAALRPAADVPRMPIRVPEEYGLASQAEKTKGTQIMAAAIKASGLQEILKTKGPFTLLAPSDEAFSKIPKGQLEALFSDPVRLRAFVLRHLVSGKLSSRDLARLDQVPEVLGSEYAVSVQGRSLLVGEAKLIRSDIQASNGTLHVIDRVLVPLV